MCKQMKRKRKAPLNFYKAKTMLQKDKAVQGYWENLNIRPKFITSAFWKEGIVART